MLSSLINSCNTRAAASGKFHVIHSQTKQQNQSFSRLGARIWNKIPELFKSKPKQLLFKKHLQTKLLQFLVHEGVYVDVYNFADKFVFISSQKISMCFFPYLRFIKYFMFHINYLNCALQRLAMLFAVCNYT